MTNTERHGLVFAYKHAWKALHNTEVEITIEERDFYTIARPSRAPEKVRSINLLDGLCSMTMRLAGE
jgi:hypothetical protein